MKPFATLIYELDASNTDEAKIAALRRFLDASEDHDNLWMMALITDRKPKRSITNAQLREWAISWSGIPAWLVEECYQLVGDQAETMSLILPPPRQSSSSKDLSDWMDFVDKMGKSHEEGQRELLQQAWQELDKEELFVLHKLVTGGLRPSASPKILAMALAAHTQLEESVVALRLSGDWAPDSLSYHELLFAQDSTDDLSKPFPLQAASPLDKAPDSWANVEEWQIEWQWDGIRAQLIGRGGHTFLWNKEEELITDKFPEWAPLFDAIPPGTVIDGVLIARKGGRLLPAQQLRSRLSRKTITKKHIAETPVAFMAFDLLEWESEDIRSWPLQQRRAQLQALVEELALPAFVSYSAAIPAATWEVVSHAHSLARAHHATGVIIKRLDSAYGEEVENGNWRTWKAEPLRANAVLIYAQRGQGTLLAEYTFAVWEEGEMLPLTKTNQGLSEAESKHLQGWIKQHTVEKFGPVRAVVPELVFEIEFDGIYRSTRHKSGVNLDSPRILGQREDLAATEADTLATLLSMLGE